jgi:pimeloyl-ACP methyl ester carboxylesterase
MSIWPASHCAVAHHRWLFRSRLRSDGRRFGAALRTPMDRPVCTIWGADDRLAPRSGDTASHVTGDLTLHRIPGVGHFPHEEDPAAFTGLLLGWLAGL